MKRRKNRNADLDRELRDHLELEAAEQQQSGLSPDQARQAALRTFGNVGLVKENTREACGWMLLRQAVSDARYALRGMRRSPALAGVALLSLALGIGANTAIFSLADAVLRRPLPVAAPEQLDRIAFMNERQVITTVSYPIFRELRARLKSVSGILARGRYPTSIAAGNQTDRAVIELVSGNYFRVLGIDAFRGRTLGEEDDRAPLAHPVTVVSYRYWRDRLDSDPAVIGRILHIGSHPYTVIGVGPADFFGVEVGSTPDAWVPLMMVGHFYRTDGDRNPYLESMGQLWLNTIARRREGVSRSQAQAELDLVFRQILTDDPSHWYKKFPVLRLETAARGLSLVRERLEKPLLVLMALVALVLLVACANVAGLLVARSAARRQEIGMRLALGASRGRLVRQLLTESLLFSLLGGALGLLFAVWGTRFLLGFLPGEQITLALDVSTDLRALGITLAAATLCGLLFGLAPALRAAHTDLLPALKRESPRVTPWRRLEPGKLLVVLQVAISLSLLAGAGLFRESLRHSASLDIGLETRNVLTATVYPGDVGYGPERRTQFYRDLETRLQAMPGVRSVGYTGGALLSGGFGQYGRKSPMSPDSTSFNAAGGDFFAAVGNSIVRGRAFTSADAVSRKKFLVLNESAARRDFPGIDPIGRRYPRYNVENEIIGIARDLSNRGIHEATMPASLPTWTRTPRLPPSVPTTCALMAILCVTPALCAASSATSIAMFRSPTSGPSPTRKQKLCCRNASPPPSPVSSAWWRCCWRASDSTGWWLTPSRGAPAKSESVCR